MGRPVEPQLRAKLLDAVIDYLLVNGCGDVSLRPMAAGLSVSTYKLLYHFGSRAELLATAIAEAERRQIEEARTWLKAEGSKDSSFGEVLKRYWSWFCRPKNLAVFRFFIEVDGLAMRDPDTYNDVFASIFRESASVKKQPVRLTQLRPSDAEAVTTMVSAFAWGLQLDYLNTKDSDRTTTSLHAFATLLDEHIERLSAGQTEYGGDTRCETATSSATSVNR